MIKLLVKVIPAYFERMIAELSLNDMDAILDRTARIVGGTLSRNNSKGIWLPEGFEERSIQWSERGMNCLIQIFPRITNHRIGDWCFWVVASIDKEGKRYWKQEMLCQERYKATLINKCDELLSLALRFFSQIKLEELKYITDLNSDDDFE